MIGMTEDQDERLVVAFEKISKALGGLHEQAKRAGKRYWPEPGQQKEAVLSHVPNQEDEARRNLGVSDGPIEEWLELGNSEDDGPIGERTAQWIKDHPKEVKKPDARPERGKGPNTPSSKMVKGKA
jgi:hypothetical protein